MPTSIILTFISLLHLVVDVLIMPDCSGDCLAIRAIYKIT
ncbi:hypothetical protein [Escherichia phage IMM-001]|nr:hypothetical protein [Escherichia phage IMM-001]